MKIIWATPIVPYPPRDGGSIRIYQLLKGLGRRHSVHLLALADGQTSEGDVAALRQICSSVETFESPNLRLPRWSKEWWRARWAGLWDPSHLYSRPELQARLQIHSRNGGADVILLETLKMARCGLSTVGVEADPRMGMGNVIFCRQNYEPELARRMADVLPISRDKILWRVGAWMVGWAERRITRQFRYITAVSEREAAIFRRISPLAEVVVVPNGVDLDRFAPGGVRDDGQTVALTGSLRYLPNLDSVHYFYRAIWPLVRAECPEARLVVMGSHARTAIAELAHAPRVEICEPSGDIQTALASATIVVVPLRAGAGTRIKILEALAAEKAVVSTTVGCEGLDVVPSRHLVVCDDPSMFARRVVELLRNSGLRRELGANGRKLVEERYGWDSAVDVLEAFCERVAGQGRRRVGWA